MATAVKNEGQDIRLYQYSKVFGVPNKEFPSYFQIPKLTVFDQKNTMLCVGCGLASALELIYGKMFSPSWNYGKFRDDTHKKEGLYFLKAVDYLCKIGGVPFADFGIMEDVPLILDIVNDHPELLDIASKFKPSGYCNLKYADKKLMDNCVKDAISRYKEGIAVPAVSHNYFGGSHCIFLVGWNDETNKYIYQNSYGEKNSRGEIPKDEINEVVAIFNKSVELPFTDIEPNAWYEKDVKNLYFADIINGVTETTIEPHRPIERCEVFALVNRLLSKMAENDARIYQIINEIKDKRS